MSNDSWSLVLAKVVSVVMHPIFIPFYGAIMIAQWGMFECNTPWLLTIVFVLMVLCPALAVILDMKRKKISDMEISDKSERSVPYLKTLALYIIAICTMMSVDATSFLFAILSIGASLAIVVMMIVNMFWKVSAHACAIGGIAGGILACSLIYTINYVIPFIIVVIISGIVGWSRVRLKAHTAAQVYAGWLIGLVSVAFTGYFVVKVLFELLFKLIE